MKKWLLILTGICLLLPLFAADRALTDVVTAALHYEKGFLKILLHTIQTGEAGTEFDYVAQGGQELIFPFERFAADLTFFKKHKLSLLYQPLTLETTTRFAEDVTIDTVTFPADTVVAMKYGFPFYRLTYAYQLVSLPFLTMGAGAALQLRNASITFLAADGESFTSSQNLGPVPALHVNLLFSPPGGFFAYFEATGLYASSALINGATFDFEGSLLDTSLRPGYRFTDVAEAYLNLRFLGGSARGTSEYLNDRWSESRERFTANYLALWTLSLGVTVKL